MAGNELKGVKAVSTRALYDRFKHALHLDQFSPGARRWIVGIVGGIVLLIGLAMVILPGPAVVVIPLGLAILATEFSWARRWLHRARDWFRSARGKFHRKDRKTNL